MKEKLGGEEREAAVSLQSIESIQVGPRPLSRAGTPSPAQGLSTLFLELCDSPRPTVEHFNPLFTWLTSTHPLGHGIGLKEVFPDLPPLHLAQCTAIDHLHIIIPF